MNEPNRSDRPDLPSTVSQPGNLLDAAFALLTPEQQQSLAFKALERKLEIDATARAADDRHRASSISMQQTIGLVRGNEAASASDYTIRSDYNTASGRTTIEVRKSNSTVVIVIAVVIGLLALIMFSR